MVDLPEQIPELSPSLQRGLIKDAIEREKALDKIEQELHQIRDDLLEIVPKVALLEGREKMAHQILNEWGAPTHDDQGRRLNYNGRMADLLWLYKDQLEADGERIAELLIENNKLHYDLDQARGSQV